MGICVRMLADFMSDLERLHGGDLEQDTCTVSSCRPRKMSLAPRKKLLLSLSRLTQATK